MANNDTKKKRKKKSTNNRHTKKYRNDNDFHIRSAGIIVFILDSDTKKKSILIGTNNNTNKLELLHGKRDIINSTKEFEKIKDTAIRETKEESGNILNIDSIDRSKHVSFKDNTNYQNLKNKSEHISYIIALELKKDDIEELTKNFKTNIKIIKSNLKSNQIPPPYLEMNKLVILPIEDYETYKNEIYPRDIKFLDIIFKNKNKNKNKNKLIPTEATHIIDNININNSNDFLNGTIIYNITEKTQAGGGGEGGGEGEEKGEEKDVSIASLALPAAIAAATRQFDLDIKIDFLNEVEKDQQIINTNSMNDIIRIIKKHITDKTRDK